MTKTPATTTALLLAALAAAVPARAEPPGAIALRPVAHRTRARAAGTVAYVTAKLAYLDAGALDGLAPGAVLRLERRGRAAATCTVVGVTERHATCAGEDLRAGDTFAIPEPAAPAAAAEAPPKPTPAPLPEADVAAQRAAVAAAPLALVRDVAAPRVAVAGPPRVEANLVHATWAATDAGSIHQERLDAAVRGAAVGGGFRLWADLRGTYRTRLAPGERFRPADRALLEVYEAQLTAREPGAPYALALGRVLPWGVPGATSFDGAQVGVRTSAGEIGVFGGVVPEPDSTAPTTSRATAGAYASTDRAAAGSLLRGEARLAYVRMPETGARVEAEALGQLWLARRIDVTLGARLAAGDLTAPGAVDEARLDAAYQATERLRIAGGLRYFGLAVPDLAAPAIFPGRTRHGDLSVAYDLTDAVVVRATGGFAQDLESGQDRAYAGPEIALPRLLGRKLALSAGWLEEGGWIGGRIVWLQAGYDPARRFHLLARASYQEERHADPIAADASAGLLASVAADLLPNLRLRFSGYGRAGIGGGAGGMLGGVSALLGLDAVY